MGWFKRQPPTRDVTLGDYMDNVMQVCGVRLGLGPSREWLRDYNGRALEQKLGIKTFGPLTFANDDNLYPATPLLFTADMPNVFYPEEPGIVYQGNELAKARIDYRIKAMGKDGRVKFLFVGMAGTGKTALAWIVAYRIMSQRVRLGLPLGRFFEILPGQFENKTQLDQFMRQLLPYDIIFIDEIHTLKEAVGAEPLYHALADTGTPRYPLGAGAGWIDIPVGVCWLSATTEPGQLDGTTGGALRRRWTEIMLEPPTQEDLAGMVLGQRPMVTEGAASEIAARSGGLPWQALLLYEEARAIAKSEHKVDISDDDVDKAFTIVGVDEHGLLPQDRLVIQTLLRVRVPMADGTILHRMSEQALSSASGVDSATFKDRVQPKLLRLGFLTVRGGQLLTDKAVGVYQHLE